jgi:glucuronate isomerase
MRTLGIDEHFITGGATDFEKFDKWASCVPQTIRNPLFHWTHLELQRYFDINGLLNQASAKEIYSQTQALLSDPAYRARGLLRKMNVELVCTTEDPTDTLEHHKAYKGTDIKLTTAFRPDKAVVIASATYLEYLEELSMVSGVTINSFSQLCDALSNRINFFHENGCRLSDHGLDFIYFSRASEKELNRIFEKRRANKVLTQDEILSYQTEVLIFLSQHYAKLGWVQQFHLGALRNNNKRMLSKLGPDTGWDSIGDFSQAFNLSRFFDVLDSNDLLAKTIIYNLNPADNEVFATMIGNFNDGSVRGKVQWGSAWWFLDQKDGMEKHLNTLSNMGILSTFIGMLTDSRSFLSFPRHEYFRRILCNLLGNDIQKGELPDDKKWIGEIARNISYNNAKHYFNF